MQRWQLTTGLAAGAILAAVFAPSILSTISATPAEPMPHPQPQPKPLVSPDVVVATPGSGSVTVGPLTMRTALDMGAQLLGSDEDRFVVIDLDAASVEGAVRQPVHLAVVMDTSGSMDGRGKITHARMAAAELAAQLGPEDTLSLVTFSDRATTLIANGSQDQQARMQALIRGIDPGGGTNVYDGLTQGQQLLASQPRAGVKRVVLLSDGMANLGVTDPVQLAQVAGSLVRDGVTVSGLGLGLDYNEDLLAAMSDAGGGSYHFVDQPGQLSALFAAELAQMGAVVGREVTVDVNLGQGVELVEVYGYEAAITKDGYQVFLGDLYGGQSRKIVARVRVSADSVGSFDAATATLSFADVDSATRQQGAAVAGLAVTTDLQQVRASINAGVGEAAATAAAARLLEQGARAFDEGDRAGSAARLDEGSELLRELSVRYNAPRLNAVADEFSATKNEFESASDQDGEYQIKKAKERARVYSH
jgi:Ca-activated chloride channel family protein